VTQYPPKLGSDRIAATLKGIQTRLTRLETRTGSIDSGFPVAVLPGVISSSYTTGDPMVVINGAATATGPYKHLTSYTPAASDSVILAPVGPSRTYVVLGKLG
jgi:hypothetical protein